MARIQGLFPTFVLALGLFLVAPQVYAQDGSAPVIVDGRALFDVRGVSAYPAERRAEDIARRIMAAAGDPSISPLSVHVTTTPDGLAVVAGERTIMIVVDADGQAEGVSKQALAYVLGQRVAEAMEDFRREREPSVLARRAAYALGASLALLMGILAAWRAVRHLRARLAARCMDRGAGIRIQSLQIIRPEQVRNAVHGAVNLLWATALAVVVYLYLDYVLSLFPWTRQAGNELFHLVADPLRTIGWGIVRMIPDLMFIAIVIVITRYALVLIRLFFTAIENETITMREFDPTWAQPTYRLVRTAVIIFALVVAYPYIPGSDTDAFKGVSLFIGVLVSLGSTSLIGNIFAGYTLTYRRTFRKGDRVRIGPHLGEVERSRLMATYLRTPKNEMVVVPNSKIINEEVINYSTLARDRGLILYTTVEVGYDAPWRQVEAMLIEAAARTPAIFTEPKPYVLQKGLGQFAVTYELNVYCDRPHMMEVLYTQLRRNILDLFNQYGVQIMTPMYESDPPTAKVVPEDRWHVPPAEEPAGPRPGSHCRGGL